MKERCKRDKKERKVRKSYQELKIESVSVY